jgi:hypothetical protein
MAKRNNARILFVGDRRQHLSVEAGDFLKVLEFYSNIKNFELSQIIRQIPTHYRKAVQLMVNNWTAEGLERLNDLGVIEEKSHHYLSAAAKSYVDTVNSGKKCLLVSPTHREIDMLNALVRRETGLDLGEQHSKTCFQDYNWTREQKSNAQTYKPGYSIRFKRPYRIRWAISRLSTSRGNHVLQPHAGIIQDDIEGAGQYLRHERKKRKRMTVQNLKTMQIIYVTSTCVTSIRLRQNRLIPLTDFYGKSRQKCER